MYQPLKEGFRYFMRSCGMPELDSLTHCDRQIIASRAGRCGASLTRSFSVGCRVRNYAAVDRWEGWVVDQEGRR